MRLTQRAQELVAQYLSVGMTAVDATAGNGHDTLFLAQCVGPNGMVHAIDIQEAAITATRQRLNAAGELTQVVLHCKSHANWSMILLNEHRTEIDAIMMNLGYLPSGDKLIATKSETTILAIQEAFAWLKPGGIMTILAYVGHPGGDEECNEVRTTLLQELGNASLLHEEPSREGSNGPVLFWFLR